MRSRCQRKLAYGCGIPLAGASSIPLLLMLRPVKKSLASSSCRFNRRFLKYWIFSLATAVFGLVYEHFSHGVVSCFMVFAFLIPLLGGAVRLIPSFNARTQGEIWGACGILTLTVGSIVRGILEIYGTTNRLCAIYGIVGAAFLVMDIALPQSRTAAHPNSSDMGRMP